MFRLAREGRPHPDPAVAAVVSDWARLSTERELLQALVFLVPFLAICLVLVLTIPGDSSSVIRAGARAGLIVGPLAWLVVGARIGWQRRRLRGVSPPE